MTTDELIECAMGIGRRLLENGAEIHRVEESMERVCLANGAESADIYAVPAAIMATVRAAGEAPITRICRTEGQRVDLHRIDCLNALSRDLCAEGAEWTAAMVERELSAIDAMRGYPYAVRLLACAGGVAFFTLLFGGSLRQAACSFVIGTVLRWLLEGLQKRQVNTLFQNVIGGMWIGAAALAAYYMRCAAGYDTIIVGSIMALVPGLSITNALRDLIAGDFITGVTRITEALLVAAGIAVGVAIPLAVCGGFLGV